MVFFRLIWRKEVSGEGVGARADWGGHGCRLRGHDKPRAGGSQEREGEYHPYERMPPAKPDFPSLVIEIPFGLAKIIKSSTDPRDVPAPGGDGIKPRVYAGRIHHVGHPFVLKGG